MNTIGLRGSKTERDFRDQLQRSREFIFDSAVGSRLKEVLLSQYPAMMTAFLLGHTPEQGEDIYLVLVDSEHLLSVELDRGDESIAPVIEHHSLVEYQKELSQTNQILLSVAFDLGTIGTTKT